MVGIAGDCSKLGIGEGEREDSFFISCCSLGEGVCIGWRKN